MKSKAGAHAAQNPNRFHLPYKVAAGALSVMLATTLMCPTVALAADYLWIEDAKQQVGNKGNGWEWVDQDNLNLNGYKGGEIVAKGDLNIQVTGDNTVTYENGCPEWTDLHNNPYQDGIAVSYGNLSISGDGTLSVKAGFDGIYVGDGNLNIEGVNLGVTTDGSDSGYVNGIYTNGNIAINNAVVAIEGVAKNNITGIYAMDLHSKGGNIAIKDSDIKIKHNSSADGDAVGESIGILAQTYFGNIPASITIDGSNVAIDAIHAAIWSENLAYLPQTSEAADLAGGSIAITNSKIQTPEGTQICDFLIQNAFLPDGDNRVYILKGQTIGTAKEVITDYSSDEISADVTIVADKPAITPGAFDSTGTSLTTTASASIMPQTGDNAGIFAITTGVACAVAAAVLAFTRLRKRA